MSVNDPNKVPRIGQVAIVTSDMQSCIDFYTQVIGWLQPGDYCR